MKLITNWRNATVSDIEANGLDNPDIIHVLSYDMANSKKGSIRGHKHEALRKFLQNHIDKKIPVVFHNGICFDIPVLEDILEIDLSELMVIDTLDLSWYLNYDRKRHGLDSFIEDYGIKKIEVGEEEWDFHSDDPEEMQEHYEKMKLRCEVDVEINRALWNDFINRLEVMYGYVKSCVDKGIVDGTRMSETEVRYIDQYKDTSTIDEYIDRIITFLMMKADKRRLKEKCRWKVDVNKLDDLIEELESLLTPAKEELEGVMPLVPKYVNKAPPKVPFKKNGELSASGIAWNNYLDDLNQRDELGNLKAFENDNGVFKKLKEYEPPNINSSDQIKNWLFKNGWKPKTYKWVKDKADQEAWVESGFKKELKPKPRGIPQVNIDGDDGKELCPSVLELAEKIPEVMAYSKYTLIKHRYDMALGFRNNMSEDGYLKARVGGLTNTMRVKHRELTNLPSVSKPWGRQIRELLICPEGNVLLGSDLSGLEDRTKHDFMLPHDPDYVNTMMDDDYDAHILMALTANMIDEDQFHRFMKGETLPEEKDSVKLARSKGKTTNYACLPVDTTEVLTSQGWKKYSELSLQDKVLSLNTKTKNTEFVDINKMYFYEDAPLTKMSTISWELESTSNHRWYCDKVKVVKGVKSRVNLYLTTEELMSNTRILTSAPYIGGNSKVTPDQASFVGWVLSDGSFKVSPYTGKTSQKGGQKREVKCYISQSSKKYLAEVERVINSSGVKYWRHKNNSGVDVFSMKSSSVRSYWQSLGLPLESKSDIDYTQWLLSLSSEALQAFYSSFHLADGLTSKKYKSLKYNTDIFFQNQGNILDAIILASELLGRNTYCNNKNGKKICEINSRESQYLGMQKTKKEFSRVADIFCLETSNSNFVVRQGKFITITGNCVYNSGAETLSQSADIPLKEAKALLKAYWELNWAVKAIAEEQIVFEDNYGKWLINPVNAFCYSLRKENDRFSTLCQGTGSFYFDMWVDYIMEEMKARWGRMMLNGEFHDEFITNFKDTPKLRKTMEEITLGAIEKVNETFYLRRKLGCDVQFDYNYAGIH